MWTESYGSHRGCNSLPLTMSCSTVANVETSWEKTAVTEREYVRTTPSFEGFTVCQGKGREYHVSGKDETGRAVENDWG